MKIEFFRHCLEDTDIQNVTKVLRSVFLTTGPKTAEFENIFSRYVGLDRVVGLNSCTAALHLSLLALDIGYGDEVITTPMTFIATATAILHSGAKPVFVDVERETALLDVNKIEKAITSKTKAIMPVHLYGCLVDMRALGDIADRHNLKIIEDCAHCIEGERDGIRPGQSSNVACYSFYATKNLTCGEGGAIATNDNKLADRTKILRLHGMSKDAATRYTDKYRHWDMVEEGWKYNMSDIQAALLVGQISRLAEYRQKRKKIWNTYDEGFRNNLQIKIPHTRGKSARHLYTIWVDPAKRDNILHQIQEKGIGVAVNYRSIHTLAFFREGFGFKPEDFPVANLVGQSTISLPFYPSLNDSQINYIIDSVNNISQKQ